ncbi:hypothetical protein ACIBEA_29940 [Streptomyces sp. NPDC051555]|uniref:hypothetical protein n=1 Tax=Streptomyces sp. NPDC051555 TaxID=3365657 RepID=UPI0037AA62D3
MDVASYQLHRRFTPLLERVQGTADQAAYLVQQKMRERLTPTRIVVAAQKHCPEVVRQAAQRTLSVGHGPALREPAVDYLGITVLDGGGTLIVINAGALASQPQRWLDETVVHELVHAVQFGRPGSRELAMKGLRNNYGIEKLTLTRAWKTNRGIGKDEREAAALERLAREIR